MTAEPGERGARGSRSSPPGQAAEGAGPTAEQMLQAPALAYACVERWALGQGAPPPAEVADAVRRQAARLLDLPAGETLAWLDRLLTSPRPADALVQLERLGAVAILLPEVQALVGFHATCSVHHKDLWPHTLSVLERTAPDPDLRWAALLHDVGKIGTRHVGPRGRVSFLRHERAGAWLLRGVAARLEMPPERTARIAFVIEHHARVNAYRPSWSDRAVRRLLRHAGERLEDLLSFSAADFTTRRSGKAARIRGHLDELRRRIDELRAADGAQPGLPPQLGHLIVETLGIPPGPRVGDAVRWLRAEVAAGRLPAGASAAEVAEALRRLSGER